MNILIALGGGGGVLVVIMALIALAKGIFRQVTATEENTAAVRELVASVDRLEGRFNNHETRITVLEDRIKR